MEQEFLELTKDFDIPENRRTDWFWLIRNMGIRNNTHPNYSKAYEIVKKKYKEQFGKTQKL